MTDSKDKLEGLIARLEGEESGSRELDAEICLLFNYVGLHQDFEPLNLRRADDFGEDEAWLDYEVGSDDCTDVAPRLTTSLDAALSLAERALPGWVWQFDIEPARAWVQGAPEPWPEGLVAPDRGGVYRAADTAPIALCAAILKARASNGAGE